MSSDDSSEVSDGVRHKLWEAVQLILLFAAIPTLCGYLPFLLGLGLALTGRLWVGLALIAASLAIGGAVIKQWVIPPKKPPKKPPDNQGG